MASRRAPGPFALSPLQGGRRAPRRRMAALAIVAGILITVAAVGLIWAL